MTIALNFAIAALTLLTPYVAASSSTSGKIQIFSDYACADQVVSDSSPIPFNVCLPGSVANERSHSFIVPEKPYCHDGHRPDLLLFQDPCCTDGVADYTPNALYGDYGNGSCQALLGGDFVAYVFSCGDYPVPQRTVISAAFTFPAPPTTSSVFTGCPTGSGYPQPTSTLAPLSGNTSSQTTVNRSPSSTGVPTNSATSIDRNGTATRTGALLPSSTPNAESPSLPRDFIARVFIGGGVVVLVASVLI
ncbi:hypothetical protein F5884DRAFT_798812 [Xylogone sp. PMI_703]|nr:hypothetical protein F5884DRAFT_798812 [Xylogone sp. PMI_703]